jgi:hypothetical protein
VPHIKQLGIDGRRCLRGRSASESQSQPRDVTQRDLPFTSAHILTQSCLEAPVNEPWPKSRPLQKRARAGWRLPAPPRLLQRLAVLGGEASSKCYPRCRSIFCLKSGIFYPKYLRTYITIQQIFSRLDPPDVLRLARTTKDLRNVLMSRSARSIWKSAFLNDPDLPGLPEGLNEPQYANLVFSPHCNSCFTAGENTILWAFQLRLCQKCMEGRCVILYIYLLFSSRFQL